MKRIYISPSNQYANTYYDGVHNEGKVMENVARLLENKLSQYDVLPILNPLKGITDRLREANALNVDYYLVLHTNAFNRSEGRGCETYYQVGVDNTATVNRLSKEFAINVNNEISAITSSNPYAGDRGIKPWQQGDGRDFLEELRENNAPSAYCEIEYHDTVGGCAWILSHPNEIADALCRAVVKRMSLTLKFVRDISYSGHVQDVGDVPAVDNWNILGTIGLSRRLEFVKITVNVGTIKYRAHVQDLGWMPFTGNGLMAGTSGQCKRLEALDLILDAPGYTLKAQAHVQDIGWMPIQTGNRVVIGTSGKAKRIEAIRLEMVRV